MRNTFSLPNQKFILHYILGTFGLFFYMFFAIYDGPILLNDSYGYMDMSLAREPIYSLFLFLIRNIFFMTKDFYLYIVVILQGILSAYAVYTLTHYLSIEFKLSNLSTTIVFSLPILVSILFRFVADDHLLYSNTILTEGIAISLYLIFAKWCLDYLLHPCKKNFIILCFLCFICFNLRKQLIICSFLFILSILWNQFKQKRYIIGLTFSGSFATILIISSLLFDCSYNYLVNGQFIRHVNDNRFIATMLFYTADEQDSTYIENTELKELYNKIYNECRNNHHLLHTAEQDLDWFDREIHLITHYDQIQLRIMLPLIQDELNHMEYASKYSADERVDLIVQYYNKTLLPHKITDIIPVFIDNFFTGLATTASQRNRILSYWAWLVYISYIFLLVILIRKKYKTQLCKNLIIFSIFVLLSILINVCVVSAVVFCQTRYTLYNMPLLYIAYFLMLLENLKNIVRYFKS